MTRVIKNNCIVDRYLHKSRKYNSDTDINIQFDLCLRNTTFVQIMTELHGIKTRILMQSLKKLPHRNRGCSPDKICDYQQTDRLTDRETDDR